MSLSCSQDRAHHFSHSPREILHGLASSFPVFKSPWSSFLPFKQLFTPFELQLYLNLTPLPPPSLSLPILPLLKNRHPVSPPPLLGSKLPVSFGFIWFYVHCRARVRFTLNNNYYCFSNISLPWQCSIISFICIGSSLQTREHAWNNQSKLMTQTHTHTLFCATIFRLRWAVIV